MRVYISVAAVTAAYGFALTAPHFSKRRGAGPAKSKQKSSPQAYGTSPRLGVPLLRCPSGGIAYGLLRDDLLSMCPAAPYGAARPPPDEHLHSASR
ncbi:hypothetical protein C1Y08_14720 [Pseudomonas sp. FW306-02-F02-AA]|nr:hypothetical protein C1Y07_06575 [Pseudomonas sp. FW306-02-F02-AB]PMZ10764.1 hypothetical protein C1Y06_06255 [Pseudomonas sp. FW306-02-H06C]PMZ15301.1 hypothetical protein C1Y08_14720 [Pseudomonas sp. FW306-02-F02-AA]PMZ22462.1 hypothetical protein C1Y09_07460 [Pseudomonas sp. FW306-02-F08-AA]PMZ27833.1 hypothetical protein C1Y05_11770 [Pseudomonas sp. FW306-02-F04-BA]PMZ35830.1 hypothetical protein C1X99_03140 [Pseudomonas sp. FW306-02-H06B]PMZ40282.1 hypothetical protein C1Y00_11635 [Ps